LIFLAPPLCTIVAWLTFSIIRSSDMTPTRVSSLVSLILFAGVYGLNNLFPIDRELLCSLIFGATFVGMCSHKVITERQILGAGVFFSFFFLLAAPQSFGIGGALGFSAFLSVFIVWGSSKLLN